MRRADNLTTVVSIVLKSGNLDLLEPSGPVQACNGIVLTFYVRLYRQLMKIIEHGALKVEKCRFFYLTLILLMWRIG